VTNLGFGEIPVFLLYHCNIGFPFLSGESVLTIPAEEAVDGAGKPAHGFESLSEPTDSGEESVMHPLVSVKTGDAEVRLRNPALGTDGLELYLRYSVDTLPHLTVWKYFQKRTYVLAIEPGTCRVGGRGVESAAGREVMLERDAFFTTRLEIGVRASG
jgi:hypothetical protein